MFLLVASSVGLEHCLKAFGLAFLVDVHGWFADFVVDLAGLLDCRHLLCLSLGFFLDGSLSSLLLSCQCACQGPQSSWILMCLCVQLCVCLCLARLLHTMYSSSKERSFEAVFYQSLYSFMFLNFLLRFSVALMTNCYLECQLDLILKHCRCHVDSDYL